MSEAVALGAVVGIGYGAAVFGVNAITPTTPRPILFGAVTAAYHVAGAIVVAVLLTLWP